MDRFLKTIALFFTMIGAFCIGVVLGIGFMYLLFRFPWIVGGSIVGLVVIILLFKYCWEQTKEPTDPDFPI